MKPYLYTLTKIQKDMEGKYHQRVPFTNSWIFLNIKSLVRYFLLSTHLHDTANNLPIKLGLSIVCVKVIF